MRKLNCSMLLIGLLVSPFLAAQTISVSSADINRLGIVFAPVTMIDHQSGAQVPATVINSPEARSSITALYGGVLEQWQVTPGTKVVAGTVLATIKSQEVVSVQQNWISAHIQFDQARFNQQKDRQLFSDGIIAKQRLKQTERVFQQADFQLKAMTEKLTQLGFSKHSTQQLMAGDIKPGNYYLIAPAEGILTQRYFDVGDYIEANTKVASLQRSGLSWVRARVPAKLAAMLQLGQMLSLAGSKSTLLLKQKDLQINLSTQMVEILAEFTAPVNVMPGQIVSLILPPVSEGVLIPASAVVHSGDETSVFVRTEDGVSVRKLLLLSVGPHYLAQKGINNGEEVAIQGAAVLKGIQLGLGEGE